MVVLYISFFNECIEDSGHTTNRWMSIYNLLCTQNIIKLDTLRLIFTSGPIKK